MIPAAAVILWAVLPGHVLAGTYKTFVCANPSSGAGVGAEGWTQESGSGWTATVNCSGTVNSSTGARVFNENYPPYADPGATATWTAPANTSITALDIYRAANGGGCEHGCGYARLFDGSDNLLEGTGFAYGLHGRGNAGAPFGVDSRVIYEGLDTDAFKIAVGCPSGCIASERSPGPVANAQAFRLFGGTVTLTDAKAPAVGAPTVSEGDTRYVLFSAADEGGGLKTAALEYDGAIAETVSLPDNNGRCVEPYRDPVPCLLSSNGSFALSGVPDGEHSLRIRVTDVAGNETIGPEKKVYVDSGRVSSGPPPAAQPVPEAGTPTGLGAGSVALAPGPNGEGATPDARMSLSANGTPAREVRVRFGQRVTLNGRLTDPDGSAIAGAVLDIQAATHGVDEPFEDTEHLVKTRRDGRFSYTAEVGPSRTIRFGYRANGADRRFAQSADIDVLVTAGVRLKPSRSRLRNRQSVVFTGRVLGEPVPEGKIVQMQVRVGRSWRTFGVAKAAAGGAYRFRYRFTRTTRTTTYRFRALAPQEAAYPYLPGLSRVARVKVRG